MALVWGSTLLGCGTAKVGDDDPPLEVNILVTSERVEVHAHRPGSCREAPAFPSTAACETFGWALLGVESSSTTDVCRPQATCVTEIRLESGDETIAVASGPSVGFFTNLGEADARIVLEGCGDSAVVALPPPLEGDVELEVSAAQSAINVTATGASVAGVFGRAEGLPSYPRAFMSACRSDANTVELPASNDFDSYVVGAFALGEPNLARAGSIRVFPARFERGLVSKATSLGPAWQVAAALAEQSSLYPACESYCSAWDGACELGVGDVRECAVPCVATGELRPACRDSWDALVACMRDTLSCEALSVVNYAEDPSRRSTAGGSTSCQDEENAYDACLASE